MSGVSSCGYRFLAVCIHPHMCMCMHMPPISLETPDTSTAIAGVETPDDLLARLASELFDPLAPASCVALGSTCRGIRSALTSVLEELRQSRRSAEQLTRRLAPQTGLFPTKCWRLQLMQELNLNHLRVAEIQLMQELNLNHLRVAEMADFGELIVRSSPAEHSRALAPPAPTAFRRSDVLRHTASGESIAAGSVPAAGVQQHVGRHAASAPQPRGG